MCYSQVYQIPVFLGHSTLIHKRFHFNRSWNKPSTLKWPDLILLLFRMLKTGTTHLLCCFIALAMCMSMSCSSNSPWAPNLFMHSTGQLWFCKTEPLTRFNSLCQMHFFFLHLWTNGNKKLCFFFFLYSKLCSICIFVSLTVYQ